jgi:hypothetical protein
MAIWWRRGPIPVVHPIHDVHPAKAGPETSRTTSGVRVRESTHFYCGAMTVQPISGRGERPAWQRWLDKPQSALVCFSSWILSSAVFVGAIALFGGPTQGDASESLYATWAVAHGKIACVYPPASPIPVSKFFPFYQPSPAVPPIWPLISGAWAALTTIGHTAPFPSQHALGTDCINGYPAMYEWAQNTAAIFPTIGSGYLAWFVLLAGVVAVLRASGRGRTGWEVFGVVLLSLAPIVWEPVIYEYHPQDLVALGLTLAATACVLRDRWVWAGILLGLAVASQQFALLALATLFVIAMGNRRWKLAIAAGAVIALVSLPFIIATSGRATQAVVFGTGDSHTYGGTLLWETGIRGASLVFCSRILPIFISMAIAFWASRRLRARIFEPTPLISLLAMTLSLRVIFEEGLFGYKFLALAVMLIVLAIVRGHVRGQLIAWLALATLSFNPIPAGLTINARSWGTDAAAALPLACIAIALALILRDALNHRVRWYLIAFFVVAAAAFLQWPLWSPHSARHLPHWFWQLILLSTGFVMAASPLVNTVRARRTEPAVPAEPIAV